MTEKSNRGGARENAGRKKLYAGGRQQLAISCSRAQKEEIRRMARAEGKTTAEYVLEKLGVSHLK